METIAFTIASVENLTAVLSRYLSEYFRFDEETIQECSERVARFQQSVRTKNLWVGVEFPYVDKVYRDIYYHYFASKLQHYCRNSIRIHFFSAPLEAVDFRDPGRFEFLQKNYKGFVVLRPTAPNIFGRSVLSPLLFNNPCIFCCWASYNALVNGVKLDISGFPHSSQDGEMMVCAETTIWSIMEYFSRKYAEYLPVLPHHIHALLNERTAERQLPSRGLTALDISFVLKNLGFGVKYYSRRVYGSEFYFILRCYVESGIPVMATWALDDDQTIGHIVNIIGRGSFDLKDIDALPLKEDYWYSFYDLPMDLVMIDDNHPPYRLAPSNNPATNYAGMKDWDKWRRAQIIHIVVPLYRRVYMEADEAKQLALTVLKTLANGDPEDRCVLRLFLTSSRSFKHTIAANPSMAVNLKELLISTAHSRFVWIAELTNRSLLAEKKAHGIIVIDATQPKNRDEAILGYFHKNSYFAAVDGVLSKIDLEITPFDMYSSNAKMFKYE